MAEVPIRLPQAQAGHCARLLGLGHALLAPALCPLLREDHAPKDVFRLPDLAVEMALAFYAPSTFVKAMNRRNFLHTLLDGVSASATVRTWPFRVYSFPSQFAFPTRSPEEAQRVYEVLRKAIPIQMNEAYPEIIKHWIQYG